MLTLHVFSCGHGDTLLLEMPRGKWALIDCHLPGRDALARFFNFTDSLGVSTLDYVVLTHTDFDHYRGMATVLERFSTGGRTVRFFCDSGANHKHVKLLLDDRGVPEDDVKEYVKLIKTVMRLSISTTSPPLQRLWLNDGTATVRIGDDTSGFTVSVVAPSATAVANAGDSQLLGLRNKIPDINELSIVLIAQQIDTGRACRMFLPGDVEGSGLTNALARWDAHRDNELSEQTFDVVKIPHHGSKNGHDPHLVARIASKSQSVAAVSAGSKAGCPGASVLVDYINGGWRVHCTTPRTLNNSKTSAFERTTFGSRRTSSNKQSMFDLRISIAPGGLLSVEPAASQVKTADLPAYQ